VHAVREGTGWLTRRQRIENGAGRMDDLALLDNVADNIAGPRSARWRRGGAAGEELPQALRDEFIHHIGHKRCLVEKDIEPKWGRAGANLEHKMAEAA